MAEGRQGVKRKRRPKNVCPNPMFVKWLEEWRDEATKNGCKTSYTFKKALYSMKKYPLPIYSGQEARVLEYVGAKVADMIDKRIAQYLANGGSKEDFHRIPTDDALPPPSKRTQKTTPTRKTTPTPKNSSQRTPSQATGTRSQATGTHSQSTSTPDMTNSQGEGTPKRKRQKSTKEYVPNYRSGPYALMLALYNAEQGETYKGFMFKTELIMAAQPYCDSSFTVPDHPDSYHTAWSSMANLLKKQLVTKSGHPPRFSLTDTGLTLSSRLLEQTDPILSQQLQNNSQYEEDEENNHMTITCSQPLPFKEPTKSHPSKTNKPHPSTKPITILDSDSDDDSIEILPLAQRLGLGPTDMYGTLTSSKTHSSAVQTHSKSTTTSFTSNVTSSISTSSTSISSMPSSSYNDNALSLPRSSYSVATCSSTAVSLSSSNYCVINEATTTSNSATDESIAASVDLSTPLYILRPGEFEVILCIDNTESTANRKAKSYFRGLLLEELTKNGVKFSVRNLNVGDFLWIAKEITSIAPGHLRLPESREIVLEHIVERKSMDDLADSIIDRRFHEQKFRIKLCGVSHPIYLVEEYGDMAHCKISQKGLHQAITNTHVVDDFFIKQTKDIKESMGYLTILTRHLQQRYQHMTINAYPVETLQSLKKQRHSHSLPPNTVCGVPFDKFNDFSIKNKVSTVSEMFARQLIQIPGSSVDKAQSIIEIYPTMKSLYDGYLKCSNEKEREVLMANIRFGINKRKLGVVLSRTIYSLYWKGK